MFTNEMLSFSFSRLSMQCAECTPRVSDSRVRDDGRRVQVEEWWAVVANASVPDYQRTSSVAHLGEKEPTNDLSHWMTMTMRPYPMVEVAIQEAPCIRPAACRWRRGPRSYQNTFPDVAINAVAEASGFLVE